MKTQSALLPNAVRIQWHDAEGKYQSETFTDGDAATELFKRLRAEGLRVGQKPLYNYQPEAQSDY